MLLSLTGVTGDLLMETAVIWTVTLPTDRVGGLPLEYLTTWQGRFGEL